MDDHDHPRHDDDHRHDAHHHDVPWAPPPRLRTPRARMRRSLDARVGPLRTSERAPGIGWVRRCRQVLGMTTAELGARAGLTGSRVSQIERAEVDGRVKLETLRHVAEALDCRLVYAFVPRTSFEDQVLEQARRRVPAEAAAVGDALGLPDGPPPELDRAQLEALADELIERRRLWVRSDP